MLPWLFSSRDQLPTALKPYSCVSGNGDQAVGKSEIAVMVTMRAIKSKATANR